jgi:uncharacterized protein (DUF2236 family)
MDREPRSVDTVAFERELEHLSATTADPRAGLFGPRSVLWQIDQDAATFLGAGRALLLQLAHPWVAAAVAEHSRSLSDPIGRFHRTFSIVFTMVFGTRDQALAAARRLYRLHATITGVMPTSEGPFPSGSAYEANEEGALQWVHATLFDTAILAHDLVRPPLAQAQLENYWNDGRRFAALFGIRPDNLPTTWSAFLAYNEAMWASDTLTVSPAARATADALFAGAGSWLRLPRWYRTLTAHLLPPRFREPFGFTREECDEHAAARVLGWLRRIYPWVPPRLRRVGPYQEAIGRLSGRSRPAAATRLLNRVWMGRSSMPRA